jgi:hypothetical protein
MPSSDPERALAARLVKDRLYADRIASMARDRGFDVVAIDGERAPSEVVLEVESRLGDWLVLTEPRELQAVRRWENENRARNLRAWIASGDLRGAEALRLPFACECGEIGCARDVELTLAEFESDREGRVIAVGHPDRG